MSGLEVVRKHGDHGPQVFENPEVTAHELREFIEDSQGPGDLQPALIRLCELLQELGK